MIKKYLPLWIALLLAAAATILVVTRKNHSMKVSLDDFIPEELSAVDEIAITHQGRQLRLVRSGESWILPTGAPVKDERIALLMTGISRLEIVAPVSKLYREKLARILPVEGRQISLLQKHRLVRSFYVYYDSVDVGGTCFMTYPTGTPIVMKIKGFQASNIMMIFPMNTSVWREHTLFGYRPEDIVSVEVTYPGEPRHSFRISRGPGGDRVLIAPDGESLAADPQEIADYLNYFGKVAYEPSVRSLSGFMGGQQPFAILKVAVERGSSTSLSAYRYCQPSCTAGEYDKIRFIAILESGRDTILLNYSDTDPVFRQVSDFQKK